MDKGNCSSCGHKIQKTTTNKCMFCGETLPATQKFTDEEISSIQTAKENLEKELLEQELDRERIRKNKIRSGGSSFVHSVSGGDGGDGCD